MGAVCCHPGKAGQKPERPAWLIPKDPRRAPTIGAHHEFGQAGNEFALVPPRRLNKGVIARCLGLGSATPACEKQQAKQAGQGDSRLRNRRERGRKHGVESRILIAPRVVDQVSGRVGVGGVIRDTETA